MRFACRQTRQSPRGIASGFALAMTALFILCPTPYALRPALTMDFSAHGYFRTRAEALQNPDTQTTNTSLAHPNNRAGLVSFNQMRARLEPTLKVNDHLSLHTQFDVLDNVVFGTEETKQLELLSPVVGTVTLPAGPGSVSMGGGEAGENKALNFRRAYMDILTPVGKLRVGRQPSHWGLGIFQNDGNGRQGDFGDTTDRILFMTQYEFNDGGALSGGVLWDIAFEAQSDPRIQGFAGNITANSKDTHQYAAILLYERPEFSAGVFGGVRRRSSKGGTTTTALGATDDDADGTLDDFHNAGIDGNTLVYFGDIYGRYTYEEYNFKAEYVFIGGKMSTGVAINAIPFLACAGSACTSGSVVDGIISLPAEQDVQVSLAALEANGVYKWGGEWNFKGGLAQGDASPLSQRITQYGFRPDYNVALLMFNVPLGTSPAMYGANTLGQADQKLTGGQPITGNFVNNAIYASVGYMHHLDIRDAIKDCNDFSVGGRVTTAWAHKNAVDLNFQALLSNGTLPVLRNSSKWYGVEADLVTEAELYDHLYASLEAGVLVPGGAYDIKVEDAVLGTQVDPIPFDNAEISYGGRLTLMLEF